jgi:hypothetical protein
VSNAAVKKENVLKVFTPAGAQVCFLKKVLKFILSIQSLLVT